MRYYHKGRDLCGKVSFFVAAQQQEEGGLFIMMDGSDEVTK
jgi:hypothetical protein